MGSQWPGMGRSLLKIPVFAAAIEKCHHVLAQKGVDLMRIITEEDPKIFDNIVNSFVGIAAVQVSKSLQNASKCFSLMISTLNF